MSLNLADIERRMRRVEEGVRSLLRPRSIAYPEIHEVETAPPTGQLQDVGPLSTTQIDNVATHDAGKEFGVWAVPLRLMGEIDVFRASAAVSAAAGTVSFGLAVYKLQGGVWDSTDPIGPHAKTLDLVQALGTFSTASATLTRFNATLTGKRLRLSPADGTYFVGYQSSSNNCRWFCPGAGIGLVASRIGYETRPLGTAIGDFPDQITVTNAADFVPWVALRSPHGVRIYGNPESDD